ncbi:hypothetical protein P3X46_000554 [Hevea brasiliensis]|uniref:Myb/SANT-like domain-containing protein n=1 Tax=Hevea brasiliensis TaxID=3981 RepID=A0ABQ9NC08_HEVBR|nr:hypothetical protein P3X46_000554 [Hevea brasiliensis]
MAQKMPESALKATNIDSRLSYLKRQFYALHEIKEKGSGFGWDDKQKMVTSDRAVFDEFVKSHKDAKGLFRKPFTFYDIFEEIYAKDRATGVSATNRVDAENNQSTNCISESNPADDDASGQFIGTSQDPPSGSKKQKRKFEEIEKVQGQFIDMMQ